METGGDGGRDANAARAGAADGGLGANDAAGGATQTERGDGGHESEAGGAEGSQSGASGLGGVDGSGGQGGAAGLECGNYQFFGDHRLMAHGFVRYCKYGCDDTVSDCSAACDPPTEVKDGPITVGLVVARDNAYYAGGRLDAPGFTLGPRVAPSEAPPPESELWTYLFYEPRSTSPVYPNPVKLRVKEADLQVCPWGSDFTEGTVDIDFESNSGRILSFARRCLETFPNPGTETPSYREYWLRGVEAPGCDLLSCNDIVNTSPPATITRTMPTPYSRATTGSGALTSGTYHLTSANYPASPSCTDSRYPEERPSPLAETLVIDAKDATSGTLSWVSDRASFATTRSTFAYSLVQNGDAFNLKAHHVCGDEVFGEAGSGFSGDPQIDYGATPTQLQLQFAALWCNITTSSALYTYTKQ